jgi:hypothetical protein
MAPLTKRGSRRRADQEATTSTTTLKAARASMAMSTPRPTIKVTNSSLRKLSDETRAQKRRLQQVSQTERDWQTACLEYAEGLVPELGAVIEMQANTVSLCDFPVRRWDEETQELVANDPKSDDDDETSDDYDERPERVMRAFLGPEGGTEELYRRAAWLLYASGEAGLLASTDDNKDLVWEFLSIRELYRAADGSLVRNRGGAGAVDSPVDESETYTARLHRSSGSFTDLATCEVKRVLPVCEQIVTFTQLLTESAKSQIPAKMLYIPDDIRAMSARPEDEPDSDTETDDTDIVSELYDHIDEAISDTKSGARQVPLAITGPYRERGSGIEVIDWTRDLDAIGLQEVLDRALGRLAAGIDAPPEMMTGKTAANHWTAANIDSEFIVKHIQPIGILIASFITTAYLRPMLIAFEGMSEDEALLWQIVFDPSPVIARADEAKSARDLADWLSDEAILTANGFTSADLASTEVQRNRRLWQLVRDKPEYYGRLLTLIPGMEDIPEDKIGPEEPEPTPPQPGAVDPNAPVDEPPAEEPVPKEGNEEPESGPPREALAILVRQLASAADVHLSRALERAGNKVVSKVRNDPMIRDRLRSKRRGDVMSLVTAAELAAHRLTPTLLLEDAWDELGVRTREQVAEFLESYGLSPRLADERAAFASQLLCEQMQQLTETNLCNTFRRNGNGLRIPDDMVAAVLEVSGVVEGAAVA